MEKKNYSSLIEENIFRKILEFFALTYHLSNTLPCSENSKLPSVSFQRAFPDSSAVKNSPAIQKIMVQFLSQGDQLEKG